METTTAAGRMSKAVPKHPCQRALAKRIGGVCGLVDGARPTLGQTSRRQAEESVASRDATSAPIMLVERCQAGCRYARGDVRCDVGAGQLDAASASNSVASASCSNSLKCSALMPDRPAAPSQCVSRSADGIAPVANRSARVKASAPALVIPCGQGVPEGRMPLATGLPAGCWGGVAIRPKSIGFVLDTVSSTVTIAAVPATGLSGEHGSEGAEEKGPCPVCSGPCPQILCNYAAPAPARPPGHMRCVFCRRAANRRVGVTATYVSGTLPVFRAASNQNRRLGGS